MTLLHRDERVLWRRTGRRIVLLAPLRDDPVVLDGTGSVIWELLERPTPHAELIAVLAELFDRPPAEVDAEVAGFVDELLASGALAAS